MCKILVNLQVECNKICECGLELIGKAYDLAEKNENNIEVCIIAKNIKNIKNQLKTQPISKVHYFEQTEINNTDVLAYNITKLCEKNNFEIILFSATPQGRAIAPIVATNLETGLTADCTQLKIDADKKMLQIRPAFGESLLAYIKTKKNPQIATVRHGVMKKIENLNFGNFKVEKYESCKENPKFYKILNQFKDNKNNFDIRKEKILIVLGAGVSSKEEIKIFSKWAKILGAGVGCSRKLVERGEFTRQNQIGLSGNTVSAEVMITIGVSGSIQFQAGIKKVKKLISINSDKNAPILQIADIPVLMDLHDLAEQIKELCI